MTIFLNILFLIIGMALLIKGADFFVSGASAIAKRLRVPSLFIGLTIVALGTSLPELSVSIVSAISKSVDLSVGNVVGSNMFNMLFALGIVAMFAPVKLSSSTKKIDLPFMIAVTGLLMIFGFDVWIDYAHSNILSRVESIILIVILVLYLYILINNAKKGRTKKLEDKNIYEENNTNNNQPEEEIKDLKIWQIILYVTLGLGAVVFGGECVSSTAKYLALQMGMSEALVGLTIVAIGTSLPELVTSIVAARKKENDLALGNVIGSNILNISLILGSVGLISQAPISTTILTDIIIMFVCTVLFSVLCVKKGKLSRVDGIILFTTYISYIAFAIIRNYAF